MKNIWFRFRSFLFHALIRKPMRGMWHLRMYLVSSRWRRLHPLVTHPKIVAAEIALLAFWLLVSRGDEPDAVTLLWTNDHYEVSERFLGVAIDAAMLTDGEWWEGSDSPPRPLDFRYGNLLEWATVLSPGWVRLGGTEADKLWLNNNDAPASVSVLDRPRLQQFLAFVDALGAKPFVTVSTGPATRLEGQWQPDQLIRLLSWLPEDFDGNLEFGNEPGAHWLIFGRQHQVGFDQLAREFNQAQRLVNAYQHELAGPANAFWPQLGEPLKRVFGSSREFLEAGARPDIFTWHYYPTQSRRCGVRTEAADWRGLLGLNTLKEFERWARTVGRWVQRESPDSILWLGETGPAQCGGVAELTDRFGASLWWLSHLGVAAQTGHQVVIRQSLVGGDYALLSYLDGGYSPNPDFWASVMWQQLMGPRGFRVADSGGPIRALAHCHPSEPNTLTLLLVNLLDHQVTVSLPQMANAEFIDVTSPELTSRLVFIESQIPHVFDWANSGSLPWQPVSNWRPLPPHSYRWTKVSVADRCERISGTM